MGNWYEWVCQVIPYVEGNRILEIGSGTGHLLEKLMIDGFHPIGVDHSYQMCMLGRNRIKKLTKRQVVIRSEMNRMPFMDQYFDTIIVTFPTDELFSGNTLMEVRRVLQRNGNLVILIGITVVGKSLIAKAMKIIYQITGEIIDEHHHLDLIIKKIKNEGFQVNCIAVEVNWARTYILQAHRMN